MAFGVAAAEVVVDGVIADAGDVRREVLYILRRFVEAGEQFEERFRADVFDVMGGRRSAELTIDDHVEKIRRGVD